MSGGAMTGLIHKRGKGAAMEAHAGTIGIRTGRVAKPRRSRWAMFRAGARQRRLERARRAHALRESGPHVPHVPGSEHVNLLPRRGGF
jgi:hypothetical protein